jgi:hypothetical protein
VNPGQYYEDDAGQYNEANPGQYHEENPGQYYDPHLQQGQYHEVNPGKYNDQLDVQVTLLGVWRCDNYFRRFSPHLCKNWRFSCKPML